MKILAIETSCDETAIALLECEGDLAAPKFKILGNSLYSQVKVHEKYGGVYPMLAKREHIKNLPPLLEKTLREAGENLEHPNLDYIAVTQGPGLEPAFWTGITFAEELAKKWHKPLIPVNHMEGHIWSVIFNAPMPEFPALALLVSGGHTELVFMRSAKEFEIIGQTRDDAVGEAFDKAARLLGLPYPGGPEISKLAALNRKRIESGRDFPDAVREQTDSIRFPRPMLNSDDFDFSYSGLKTAVLYKLKEFPELTDRIKQEVAQAFEDAAIEVLIAKARKAIEKYNPKTLIVGGGVAGNTYLRAELDKLQEEMGITLRLPERSLTTDNAVMIGLAAYLMLITRRFSPQSPVRPLQASGQLKF